MLLFTSLPFEVDHGTKLAQEFAIYMVADMGEMALFTYIAVDGESDSCLYHRIPLVY